SDSLIEGVTAGISNGTVFGTNTFRIAFIRPLLSGPAAKTATAISSDQLAAILGSISVYTLSLEALADALLLDQTAKARPVADAVSYGSVEPLPSNHGDANEDGFVNAADAAAILRHLVELVTLSEQGLKNALVTVNKSVSAADAAKLLRWLVELEDL
ncbi:MAG: dockerin type I repeat-containing protein, partial [Clostridiales bacterium]|nr:dockerin type I repeat-containing protein [Clostridiales bacterium]